jgi:hypothetical protein
MATADQVAHRTPFRDWLDNKQLWRHQYGADETRQRLHAAGFEQVEVWLEDSPQRFASANELADFARTVVLSRHVAALPEEQRDPFVAAVVESIHTAEHDYSLDYVRLNIDARRPRRSS